MKRWLGGALVLASCTGGAPHPAAQKETAPPPPNTVVTTDSLSRTDGLNSFTFAVTLRSTDTKGIYDVLVHDGPKEAAGQFTMPRGAEGYPVQLRRDGTNAFQVGFSTPDDTTFLPYYRIAAAPGSIEMKYTHAYSFR